MDLAKYFRSFKALRGGLHLPDDALDVGHRDFRPLPAAPLARLHVPLAHGAEDPASPLVSSGERVTAGQPIARAVDGVCTHAPMSGAVRAIARTATPYAGDVPAIEIATDDTSEHPPAELLEGQIEDAPDSRAAFIERMQAAGVHVPALAEWAANKNVRAIIVCGLDQAPPQSCRTQMLFRYGATIIEAAALIHKLFAVHRTYLAVDRAHRSLVRLCEERSRRTPVRIAPLDNKYPQAADVPLVRTVLNRTIRPGDAPAWADAVVLGAADLVDMARALRSEPVTHRLISIAGDAVNEPGNYRVPIGARISEVVRATGVPQGDARIVVDCLMSGPGLADANAVVTKQTSAIFRVIPANDARPTPCIRCGYCQDACPVELDPVALSRAVQRDRAADIAGLHPSACLACGLCDYVCPSELPLMHHVLTGRESIREC